jgi:hypothetical protein
MPGPAFQFKMLDNTITALHSVDATKAAVMRNNLAFAYLGALGPDLLRYLPVADANLLNKIFNTISTDLNKGKPKAQAIMDLISGLSQQDKVTLFANPMMVAYELMFLKIVPVYWPLFQDIHNYLDKMDAIAAAQDVNALKAMKSAGDTVQTESAKIKSDLKNDLTAVGVVATAMISVGIPWVQSGAPFPFATRTMRISELLRWRRTGQFALQLVTLAKQDTDPITGPQKLAYAYGYLSAVAASVTAEPFVNNITGGPYRTHWWRNRFVQNFIDAWTWGRYQPGVSMSGDNPTPPYFDPMQPSVGWANLCEAQLQNNINNLGASPLLGPDAANAVSTGPIPPGALPDSLSTLLATAFANTFAGVPTPPGIDQTTFNNAYVGAVAVLWFMTGGGPPLCVPPLGPPPATCTSAPSWVTSGSPPPSPVKAPHGADGWTIFLAILALLAYLAGNCQAGAAAVAGAIANALSGAGVDWNQLRCNLFWLRKTIFDGEDDMRANLLNLGLIYPMNRDLGKQTLAGTTPAADQSGTPLLKTKAYDNYPHRMDKTDNMTNNIPDLDYLKYPPSPIEEQATMDWPTPDQYPDAALDGLPLQNQGVRFDNGAFPTRGVPFGSAVPNAVDLIAHEGAGLVDYNLDADRGYGWKTWTSRTDPSTGSVTNPEQA